MRQKIFRNMFRKKGKLFLFLMLCLSLAIENVYSQEINYKSQSLYIYIFTKNIAWPTNMSKNDFKIGVYGNSPIYDELKIMASLKKAGEGQTIVVEKIKTIDEIDNFHIIYLCSSKSREIAKILEQIKEKATLLVAERDGLAKKGASINFLIMENDNLRFEINTQALNDHNLQISEKLLKRGFIIN